MSLFPVKPLAEHPDANTGHAGGSQSAANNKCAQNMRKGAFSILHSKTKGETTGRVVCEGKREPAKTTNTLHVALLAMAGAAILIALMAR